MKINGLKNSGPNDIQQRYFKKEIIGNELDVSTKKLSKKKQKTSTSKDKSSILKKLIKRLTTASSITDIQLIITN